MMYVSSGTESLMFMGTKTAPAMGTPLCNSSMTWLLTQRAATLSPGPMPALPRRSTSRCARSANSRYVKERSPSTIAFRFENAAAARSRKDAGFRGI